MGRIAHVLIATALTGCITSPASSQIPVRRDTYPSIDSTVVIVPTDTIRLLNRVVLAMAPGAPGAKRYDLQYASRIPVADSAGRRAQADRLAPHFGAGARQLGAERMLLALCDSSACAETREPASLWYEYAFTDGRWQRLPR